MTLNEIKTNDKKFWQRLLRLGGYYKKAIDGIRGSGQIAAEEQWDKDVADAKDEFGVFDDRTEKCLETLIPEMQKYARQFLSKAIPFAKKQWDIDVKVIQGTRSYAEQNDLYAQGRTKRGSRVTNARGGYSNHNFGVAFDLGLFKGGDYLTKDTYYDKLARECGYPKELIWGGNWKSLHDAPHYQLAKFGNSTSGIREIF